MRARDHAGSAPLVAIRVRVPNLSYQKPLNPKPLDPKVLLGRPGGFIETLVIRIKLTYLLSPPDPAGPPGCCKGVWGFCRRPLG